MKRLRHWINNHVGIAFVITLTMFAVSGWAAYRYAQQMGLTIAADADKGTTSHIGCGGCGMGGVEGKLAEVGRMTLAGDAVRKYLQKEAQGEVQVELQDMKIEAPGIVLVTAHVNGKERRFRVDLSVPQGKVKEVPITKGSPPHKGTVKVPAKGS